MFERIARWLSSLTSSARYSRPSLATVGEGRAIWRRAVRKASLTALTMMPIVDGFETIETARAANPRCQVIVHSGVSTPESLHRALSLGATDYVEKCSEPEVLLDAIETAYARIVRWACEMPAERLTV